MSGRLFIETIKWLYVMLMAFFFVLFCCLVLDVFSYFVAGGWNTFLGAWPIFSGTVSAFVYGSWSTVLCLGLSITVIARIILWERTPFWMQALLDAEA
jgi:hypothetical protein